MEALAALVTAFGTVLVALWAVARVVRCSLRVLWGATPPSKPLPYGTGPARVIRRTVPLGWRGSLQHVAGCDCAACSLAGSWESDFSADVPVSMITPVATVGMSGTLPVSRFVSRAQRLPTTSVVPFLGFGGGLIHRE